jgi:hypothetical protein
MRKRICAAVATAALIVSVMTTGTAFAGDSASVFKVLLEKGVITEAEYRAITDEQKADEKENQVLLNTQIAEAIEYNKPEEKEGWVDRVKLSGLLEGEYRWIKSSDVSDKDADAASDLYVRRLELGIEAELTDWIKANAVLNSEFIGDSVNEGDELITVDEAVINLRQEDVPVYLVLGKRVQPFGVFENHLVTDPMTQDAYEAKRVGLTLGATGPIGLDLSATLYKGEEQMDHLVDSGLFEAARAGDPGNDVGSYIVSASISPVEDSLTLFGSYLSEPGRGDRNETANFGLSAAVPGIRDLRLDAEYMKALKREKFDGLEEAFKEGVYSVTASYVINNGERREEPGGATLAERLAHILEEPLELAFRYERFDDDGLAEKTSSWSVKNRYSVGASYPFFKDEDKGLAAYVAAEYRYTDFRLHDDVEDVRADNNKEVFLRLGAAF